MSATALPEQARLSPLERLEALCDPGSVRVLRSRVISPRLGDVARRRRRRRRRHRARWAVGRSRATPRTGRISAARWASATPTRSSGCSRPRAGPRSRSSRSSSPAAPGCKRARPPLAGYGRIFRHTVALTGVVPQISIVSGASAGGGAYSPALTDLILMTEDAAMFLTGPGVVREALGEEIDAAGLGGPRVHDRNGVCHLVERDERAAATRVRELLSYLPSAAGEPLPRWRLRSTRPCRIPGRPCPASHAAPTTCATRSRRSSTAARCSSCARAGRATW